MTATIAMNVVIVIFIFVIVFKTLIKSLTNIYVFAPTITNDIVNIKKVEDYYKLNGLNIEINEKYIDSDNDLIHLFYLKNKNKLDRITIYCHGNSGCIESKFDATEIKNLLRKGSVILYDYRGYGKSSGVSCEESLKTDATKVYEYVINELHFEPQQIVVYGFSLGCFPATHLANNYEICGVVLEGGFSSLTSMAKRMIPILSSFIPYEMNNANNIIDICKQNKKIMIAHTFNDEIVPIEEITEIEKTVSCPIIKLNGSHNNAEYDKKYFEELDKIYD